MSSPALRNQAITREAFDIAARGHIRKPQREMAYAWVQHCERNGHRFPSAANAVHVWTVRRLARQSHSRSTEPHPGANHLP